MLQCYLQLFLFSFCLFNLSIYNLLFQLQCCGVETYKDWELNMYFNCSSPGREACGVPFSCCKPTEVGQKKLYFVCVSVCNSFWFWHKAMHLSEMCIIWLNFIFWNLWEKGVILETKDMFQMLRLFSNGTPRARWIDVEFECKVWKNLNEYLMALSLPLHWSYIVLQMSIRM